MKAPLPAPVDWEVVKVLRVIDGDTVDLQVRRDIGTLDAFTIQAVGPIRVRLVHLDTPEKADREAWERASDDLSDWLDEFDKSVDGGLRVVTQGVDAFGRDLGDIYAAVARADTATQAMIRLGWPVWTG